MMTRGAAGETNMAPAHAMSRDDWGVEGEVPN